MDPIADAKEYQRIYEEAIAYPEQVRARMARARAIQDLSPMRGPPTAPPQYDNAFRPIASFIQNQSWEGARFAIEVADSKDLDTIAFAGVKAEMGGLSGKCAQMSLGVHKTSTAERVVALASPDGRIAGEIGGKITPATAAAVEFSVAADSTPDRVRFSGEHITADSCFTASFGGKLRGSLTAAASYVQRLAPGWMMGAKTDYNSTRHPHTRTEITLGAYKEGDPRGFKGLDNILAIPEAEGMLLKVADDHCSVVYHKRVNHALTWESEFSVGMRAGQLDSATKTGIKWSSTSTHIPIIAYNISNFFNRHDYFNPHLICTHARIFIYLLNFTAPQGSIAMAVASTGVYTSEVKYAPVQHASLGVSSFYLSETADLRLGASLTLGHQYENFPRATYPAMRPSMQWWNRWRELNNEDITMFEKEDLEDMWKGFPTFAVPK